MILLILISTTLHMDLFFKYRSFYFTFILISTFKNYSIKNIFMTNKKVSLVIPFYNEKNKIYKTIKLIKSQTIEQMKYIR